MNRKSTYGDVNYGSENDRAANYGNVNDRAANYGLVIVGILFLGLFVGNYFQYQLSPLAPELMESYSLSPTQFSSIFSAPMLPAVFLGIVAGILSDRLGVKKVCSLGLIIMAVGLWIRLFADSYTSLFLSMVLSGFGVSFLNVNLSKIISGWFPKEKIGPIMGITMVGCTLGMTIGTATTAYLPSIKTAFALTAVLGTVVLGLWILLMKDGEMNCAKTSSMELNDAELSDAKLNDAAKIEIHNQESASSAIKASLKSKNIWLVGICLMCIVGCNVSLSSFLPTAFMSRGLTNETAGLLTTALAIGNLIGSFAGTMLIAKIGKMKPCLLILSMIVAICGALAWNLNGIGIVLALTATGFGLGTLVPTFMSFPALLPEIGPEYAGSATGIITTLELLGAVVIPTYIITPIAGNNYSLFFALSGAVMFICAAVILLLPELLKGK